LKTKKLIVSVIALFSVAVILAGCGKSEKEVKVSGKENTGSAKGKSVSVSTTESTVEWLGKKVTGQHHGTVKLTKGEFMVDEGKLTGGKFEMDMNSIVDIDLTDSAFNAKLINHLKSEDFFSAAKFPFSKFEITKVEMLNDPNKPGMNNTITGNLTIKDITKSISFPSNVKIEGGVVNATADFDIDRTQWDVKYGSGKFFENLGDKMISDNFNLKLKLIAK